jgi:hypothetical protein
LARAAVAWKRFLSCEDEGGVPQGLLGNLYWAHEGPTLEGGAPAR